MVTDGTVVWIIDDLRDGTPVGAVRGSLCLPAGYIKANGATVQRADYPRLVALADKHNLWTDDVTVHAGLFGRGDGTATMMLPNWTDRMVQLAGDGIGASVAAGLPNIIGQFAIRGPSGTGLLIADSSLEGAIQNIITEAANRVNSSGGWRSYCSAYTLDASRSNPIYGASDTVQPAAIKLIPIIRY